ncbi:hypothetical protein Fraau_2349 [Frateuria aurantia DSM 6220]|uniref:Uncharacterized protein n=1 Tax=Frateuria aurantia (strain ATCC 33424 / DSM 6220 / KCTC 2777 / LMG 1558 / NBRC 3245 / NCIMB 13370) TaxID=767434 RepID=H8L5R0_FRAAD|nr:hypothetical protein Fraau_2349 [Frateuria aurantia DSM 6220]
MPATRILTMDCELSAEDGQVPSVGKCGRAGPVVSGLIRC